MSGIPSFSSSLRAAAGASGVCFCSGGYSAYRISGVVTSAIRPGTRPASAHWPQLMVKPSESLARLTCCEQRKASSVQTLPRTAVALLQV